MRLSDHHSSGRVSTVARGAFVQGSSRLPRTQTQHVCRWRLLKVCTVERRTWGGITNPAHCACIRVLHHRAALRLYACALPHNPYCVTWCAVPCPYTPGSSNVQYSLYVDSSAGLEMVNKHGHQLESLPGPAQGESSRPRACDALCIIIGSQALWNNTSCRAACAERDPESQLPVAGKLRAKLQALRSMPRPASNQGGSAALRSSTQSTVAIPDAGMRPHLAHCELSVQSPAAPALHRVGRWCSRCV